MLDKAIIKNLKHNAQQQPQKQSKHISDDIASFRPNQTTASVKKKS